MASREKITRKQFKEFPELREYFIKLGSLHSSGATEEINKLKDYWNQLIQKDEQSKPQPRMLWTGKPVPDYVADMTFMACSEKTVEAAKKFCMAFSGDMGCATASCKFRHKCLCCGKEKLLRSEPEPHSYQTCRKFGKLRKEAVSYHERFGHDPFSSSQENDLIRLATDEPKRFVKDEPANKQKKKSSGASSSSQAGPFAALADSGSEDDVNAVVISSAPTSDRKESCEQRPETSQENRDSALQAAGLSQENDDVAMMRPYDLCTPHEAPAVHRDEDESGETGSTAPSAEGTQAGSTGSTTNTANQDIKLNLKSQEEYTFRRKMMTKFEKVFTLSSDLMHFLKSKGHDDLRKQYEKLASQRNHTFHMRNLTGTAASYPVYSASLASRASEPSASNSMPDGRQDSNRSSFGADVWPPDLKISDVKLSGTPEQRLMLQELSLVIYTKKASDRREMKEKIDFIVSSKEILMKWGDDVRMATVLFADSADMTYFEENWPEELDDYILKVEPFRSVTWQDPSKTVYIINYNRNPALSADDVLKNVAKYGEVKECRVVTLFHDSEALRSLFVEFHKTEDASKILRKAAERQRKHENTSYNTISFQMNKDNEVHRISLAVKQHDKADSSLNGTPEPTVSGMAFQTSGVALSMATDPTADASAPPATCTEALLPKLATHGAEAAKAVSQVEPHGASTASCLRGSVEPTAESNGKSSGSAQCPTLGASSLPSSVVACSASGDATANSLQTTSLGMKKHHRADSSLNGTTEPTVSGMASQTSGVALSMATDPTADASAPPAICTKALLPKLATHGAEAANAVSQVEPHGASTASCLRGSVSPPAESNGKSSVSAQCPTLGASSLPSSAVACSTRGDATANSLQTGSESNASLAAPEGSPEDLQSFLKSLQLETCAKCMLDEQIDMETLHLLSDEDLEKIGLKMGPRRKIMRALAKRQAQ